MCVECVVCGRVCVWCVRCVVCEVCMCVCVRCVGVGVGVWVVCAM